MRSIVSIAFAGLLMGVSLAESVAQPAAYPSKPVTIIVPAAAGGPSDAIARLIGERLAEILGQQFVIENVPGAGGVNGAARAVRAAPDGHTLLMHQTGLTIQPALDGNSPFNVLTDLTAIGLVNKTDSFLIGRSSLPANNMSELAKWMRETKTLAKFAHPGVGTSAHLRAVRLARLVGASVDLIPYRGTGPAINDILGQHVDLAWAGAVSVAPLIKAGKVKAYAYGGDQRSMFAPDVPTIFELDYKDFAMPFWHALFVPANTPKAIVEKLNAALRKALQDPRLQKAYSDSGLEAYPAGQLTIEAANAYVRSEVEKWDRVVKELGLQKAK